MGSTLSVTHLRGLTSGNDANKIYVDSDHSIIGTNVGQIYAPGTVVNIENAVTMGSSGNTTTATSFTDTGVSLTITPKLTNSKFMVNVFQIVSMDDGTSQTRIDFRAVAVQDSTTTEIYRMDYFGNDGTALYRNQENCSGSGVYTNTTGNQIVFKTQVQKANGSANETDTIHMTWYNSTRHQITVMEIAQ